VKPQPAQQPAQQGRQLQPIRFPVRHKTS
jgi:hypothetical protein